MKESEKARKQRLQYILSGRSRGDGELIQATNTRNSEPFMDDEDEAATGHNFNTETLIEY